MRHKSRVVWEDIPLILSIKDLCEILEIGTATAYALVNQEGFPKVQIGKSNKIYRDSLRKWLEVGTK
ncbi:MAG: hypothetical protein H6Q66_1982 [Firmicutes bacterium]|nr:hypothetical protein [Bacillota bacterium]